MRTLVISDLHLGNRAGRDVLRRPEPLARLLEALDGVDRLVLLGDLAELANRNPRRSLAAAEPVLRALGRQMAGGEIIVVPGNHDHAVVRSWARQTGAALTNDSTVPDSASRALARIVGWLGPAPVTVKYPGVWLDERVYATHGHFLNHHLIPPSAVGLPRSRLRGPVTSTGRPVDYELGRHRGTRDVSLASSLERPLRALRSSLLSRLPRVILDARLSPAVARGLDLQMRHGSLPALGRVMARLEINADWVIFGHVHRLGPRDGDRPKEWRFGGDGPRLLNSGSWLEDPLLIRHASPPHPYWPGGAVLLEPDREPTAIGLLDGLRIR